MKIDYIKMKNYRQYRNQKIDFPVSSEKQFIVVVGGMGAGKTNLLNALTWCFYGKEPHIGTRYQGLPIINTSALDEMKKGAIDTVEVEVQLSHEDRKYRIKRTLYILKSPEGEIKVLSRGNQKDGSQLEIWAQIGKNVGYFRDPSRIIRKLIPEDIYQYFLFDGERLNDYFRAEAGEKIKEAIFKISQLELLDRVINHLEEVKRDLVRRSKKTTPDIQRIVEQMEIEKKSIEEKKKELNQLLKHQKEGQQRMKEIHEKLRTIPDIKPLAEEREKRGKKKEELLNKLDEIKESLNKYLVEMAPQIFGWRAITQTWDIIDKAKEAGEIPPDIKKNFLKKLLDKGCCICGTDISREGRARRNVLNLLEECNEITNISDELIRLHIQLSNMMENVKKFSEKYIGYEKELNELKKEFRENDEKIEEIEGELKKIDLENIGRLEKEYEEYQLEINKISQTIGLTQGQIDSMENKIRQLEEDLEKELANEKKLKSLNDQVTFCKACLDIASKIKNEIMEETRNAVEEKTEKQFLELGWKTKTYTDVKIDNNYNISVKDQFGLEALGTLSAGERQLLALSFIGAINKVSGFEAPIVIDTPLGRVAEEPTKNVAEKLPMYFKGKQVILLVTDKEYSPEVRSRLSKAVSREYQIKFKESERGSIAEVVPYGE